MSYHSEVYKFLLDKTFHQWNLLLTRIRNVKFKKNIWRNFHKLLATGNINKTIFEQQTFNWFNSKYEFVFYPSVHPHSSCKQALSRQPSRKWSIHPCYCGILCSSYTYMDLRGYYMYASTFHKLWVKQQGHTRIQGWRACTFWKTWSCFVGSDCFWRTRCLMCCGGNVRAWNCG